MKWLGEEVTREWRKLRNEELHNFFCSVRYCQCDLVKEDGMGGTCSTYRGDVKFNRDF
jgi:hypothetical protein